MRSARSDRRAPSSRWPSGRRHGRARLYQRAAPLVVIAVDVQDPGNVGAIVRVAEAAGATGVVAAGASANPFGWKALRGSMGSALRLPIVAGVTADDGDRRGAQPRLPDRRHRAARRPAALRGRSDADRSRSLVGGEGRGPAGEALVDAADERVTIPMEAPVESLNAAVTAAVLLYEARRVNSRRTTRKRH